MYVNVYVYMFVRVYICVFVRECVIFKRIRYEKRRFDHKEEIRKEERMEKIS